MTTKLKKNATKITRILPNGTLLDVNGRKVRVTWIEIKDPQLQLRGLRGRDRIAKMKDDEALTLPNGVRFYKQGDNLYRILNQDVTLQKVGPDYQPLPSAAKISKASETSSGKAVRRLPKLAKAINTLLVAK